ncbi:MAG: low molecular weight protein-tyrosine-phosphatase [Acidimicrobiia bacterium]
MKILAVCAGNICRSPAAEAAIREAAVEAGIDIEADSAGTGAWHIGQPPHPESVAAGARAGLVVQGRARKVTAADFDRFDIILAMDRANLRDLHELAPSREAQARTRLFRTYDPAASSDEVPDPWGGPESGYDETVRIVRAAAIGLVSEILEHSRA